MSSSEIDAIRKLLTSKPRPVGWDERRKRDYFAWALAVVAGCRGVNAFLEEKFDEAYRNGQS